MKIDLNQANKTIRYKVKKGEQSVKIQITGVPAGAEKVELHLQMWGSHKVATLDLKGKTPPIEMEVGPDSPLVGDDMKPKIKGAIERGGKFEFRVFAKDATGVSKTVNTVILDIEGQNAVKKDREGTAGQA